VNHIKLTIELESRYGWDELSFEDRVHLTKKAIEWLKWIHAENNNSSKHLGLHFIMHNLNVEEIKG
jgi:hypothetical protein